MWFLADIGGNTRDGRLDLWALPRYRPEVASDLAAWLDRLLSSEAVTDLLTDPDLPPEAAVWIPSVAALRGQITAATFGG